MAQERVSGPGRKPPYLPGPSVAIIAGGRSHGIDPSIPTLVFRGRPLLSILVEEMKKVSNELIILNGEPANDYSALLGNGVRMVPDEYKLGTPLGGILSTFPQISNEYVAFISCEFPFVRSQVVSQLYKMALGGSAALPLDKESKPVPLCGVYSVRHAEEAALKVFAKRLLQPSDMVSLLPEPRFIREEIGLVDPQFTSLTSVRSQSDLNGISL